jgi:polyferredoxin
MKRIGRPRGLVDYLALSDEKLERAGSEPRPIWKHALRPRTILYTALWSLVGIGLVFALFIRSDLEMTVSPVRNPTYVTLADGSIRNVYEVRLLNKVGEEREVVMTLGNGSLLDLSVGVETTLGESLILPPDETVQKRLYITASPDQPEASAQRSEVRIWVEDVVSGTRTYKDTTFNGKASQ